MERKNNYEPTRQELKKWLAAIEEAIKLCVKSGTVHLIIFREKKDSISLRIIENESGDSIHLLEAVPQDKITPREIDDPDHPWELPIVSSQFNLTTIAKELPAFMHFFYPQADGLPIAIYQNRSNFLQNKPTVVAQFENDLVTLQNAA